MNNSKPAYFIAVGASGQEGLADIIELLQGLEQPTNSVVMVVLHRPSDKISYLQQILSRNCTMPVFVAEEAEDLIPGSCYIGEPDGHLTLVDQTFAHLVPDGDNRFRGKTVDILFNSLAAHAGVRAIGIILSGALSDGSRGLAAMHEAGGITMVLDPGHKTRGMQQNAIDYDGPISFIGTSREIAEVVKNLIVQGYPDRKIRPQTDGLMNAEAGTLIPS